MFPIVLSLGHRLGYSRRGIGAGHMADDGETWARRTAQHVVDGLLAASERYRTPDQIALLREVVRRVLWHMPNSSDEIRDLARYFYLENLRQLDPRDDEPPER
jgi:hypothetical protein